MKIDITGHQMEVTSSLRQHIEDMVEKISHLTDTAINKVHVVLEVSKQRHLCSMTISIGGDSFTVKEESDNMYNAIDGINNKIRRQMREAKARHKDARRS